MSEKTYHSWVEIIIQSLNKRHAYMAQCPCPSWAFYLLTIIVYISPSLIVSFCHFMARVKRRVLIFIMVVVVLIIDFIYMHIFSKGLHTRTHMTILHTIGIFFFSFNWSILVLREVLYIYAYGICVIIGESKL